MDKKETERQQELSHFQTCQAIIRGNISRYQEEYDIRHTQVQELYRAMNSGDVELYNQLMTVASLEEQAAVGLRKNKAALVKPYFGRIDYTDYSVEKNETVYIGKNGVFRNKTDVLIADWRAPISSVYYENELGDGEYGLPDTTLIPINLKGKRTYDIEDGSLKGYYDSDVASNDELLVKYLSRNKDVVLGEIIATIQKEQNAIIRESPFANLIVQGVAGSGKTTVAMHRISYLLYNYKERFESNEFCIVGSSDLLLNYITSGLPELDVPNIKHLRMDMLFIRLCEKDWKKNWKTVPPDSSAGLRCTLPFLQELEIYLMQLREQLIDCSPLKDSRIGTILSRSNNTTLLQENPRCSIVRLLTMLDDRVKTRINFLMSGMDKDTIQKKLHQYRGYYKNRAPKESALTIYLSFLSQHEASVSPAHIAALQRHEFDLYDLAALALIHYRVFQKKPNEEFGLLFLDEAQDFGIGIYYVLKTLLPDSYFTIMGDVSQNINYDTGINDWYELTRLFLTNPKDKFLLLQKSYRNTIEISEYAGQILEAASSGRYKITPVIRHGLPVQEETFWSDVEMAERCGNLITQLRHKEYATTAIICRDEAAAAQAQELLAGYTEIMGGEAENFTKGTMVLPISLVKGLEFDTVILWNPDMKNGLKNPRTAKQLYVAATRALHELYVFQC